MHRSNGNGIQVHWATCKRRTHRTFELLQLWTNCIAFPSRNTLFDPGSDHLLGWDVHLCPGVPLHKSHKSALLSPPSWLPSWCLPARRSGTSQHPSTVETYDRMTDLACHNYKPFLGCSVWRDHLMSCSQNIGEGNLEAF